MQKENKIIFIFSLIGLLFSGYLSFAKFFSKKCVLGEGCSIFLGYPTCYYGFLFFLIIFILSILLINNNKESYKKTLLYVSIIAVIFALYFSIIDIFYPVCPGGKCSYTLLIPSCVYGLIFYIVILVYSIKIKDQVQ